MAKLIYILSSSLVGQRFAKTQLSPKCWKSIHIGLGAPDLALNVV